VTHKREKLIEVTEMSYTGILSRELTGFLDYLLTNKETFLSIMDNNILSSNAQHENYIYSFLNECLVLKEDKIYVGNALMDFNKDNPFIYPLFILYCKAHHIKIIGLNKFIEVLNDWIRVNNYKLIKLRDKKGYYYSGLSINTESIEVYINN